MKKNYLITQKNDGIGKSRNISRQWLRCLLRPRGLLAVRGRRGLQSIPERQQKVHKMHSQSKTSIPNLVLTTSSQTVLTSFPLGPDAPSSPGRPCKDKARYERAWSTTFNRCLIFKKFDWDGEIDKPGFRWVRGVLGGQENLEVPIEKQKFAHLQVRQCI